MVLPLRLMIYFVGRYVTWILATLCSLFFIIGVADLVEQFRRTSAHEAVEGWFQIKLVLLKLPFLGMTLIPFVLLIGSTLAFLRMALSREYLVLRSVGVSLYRFLLPFSLLILLLGYGVVYLYHPLAMTLYQEYLRLDKKVMDVEKGEQDILWVRQSTNTGYMFIHLEGFDFKTGIGGKGRFYSFSPSGQTLEEWTAEGVQLQPGQWVLDRATHVRPLKESQERTSATLQTTITLETLPYFTQGVDGVRFQELPTVIKLMNEQGFSSLRYTVRYYGLLLLPFFYLGLIWSAAGVCLGASTRQSITPAILTISVIGFGLYLMRDFSFVLANTGKIPPLWGGLAPALASLFIGMGLVLRGEGH